MTDPPTFTVPAPGQPNPEALGGRDLRRVLEHLRIAASGREDLWAFMAFAMPKARSSSAQLFQDLWALWVSGERRQGYFVEFGATDGRRRSNTWLLERDMGWTGILAEPNPAFAESLRANRNCAVSTRCVHSISGLSVDFLAARKPALSRMLAIDPGDGHEANRQQAFEIVQVETISLNDLLAEQGAPAGFDYLSVDTEGSELEILSAFDFQRWRPAAITVEHNFTFQREPIFELLSGQGYRRMWPGLSGFDDWYVLDRA